MRRSHPIDHHAAADPLLRDVQFAYTVDLPVLGIPTCFQTNSRYLLDCVEESFGAWRGARGASGVAEPLHVRVVAYDAPPPVIERLGGPVPVHHLCPDDVRVIAHSPGSVGVSDPLRREAVIYVSTDLARDREHFRCNLLDALTMALVSHFDRHPFHAAAIGFGDRLLLLAGPSGAGKSTLAYAARKAGLEVFGDDRVWIQLTPTLGIWAWPGSIRLRREAGCGGAGAEELAQPNAKRKITVPLGGRPGRTRHAARNVAVCVLDDVRGIAALEQLTPSEVSASLHRQTAPGFDRFPARHARVVARLASGGGWRLRLSANPANALPLVLAMLGA